MRMWGVNPKLLCNKHLVGEHGEIHKFLPAFRRGYSVHRRFYPVVQIQFNGYAARHDALVKEMLARGMQHNSPLLDIPDFKTLYPDYYYLEVNLKFNIADLKRRCSACREIINWEFAEVGGISDSRIS